MLHAHSFVRRQNSVKPHSSKAICACKEHWAVLVIDRQIVPAEIPAWQRKVPNARVKSQPQKSPQYTWHESKLEKQSIGGKMCEKTSGFFFFFPKRRNLMLFVQTRVPIMSTSLWGPRPHTKVSSVVHYNSTPDLEEWHSSKAALAPASSSAKEGKRG